MKYATFKTEQDANNAASEGLEPERQYRPLDSNANRFGNVWVLWMPNPKGGRWHLQEDGHVG